MKKVIGFVMLLGIAVLSSCDIDDVITIRGEGSIQEFRVDSDEVNGLLLDVSARVVLKQSNVQSITVKAQENIFNTLTFNNNNGVLEIDNKTTLLDYDPITIEISVSDLQSVFNDSSGDIVFEDHFQNINILALTVDGSGDIFAKADANFINTTIDGSGDIELEGAGDRLVVLIDGSGDFKAFEYDTRQANILVDGSGRSEVRVFELLNVSVDGSGDVYYKGNPEVNVIDNGSGTIIDAN